MELIMGQYIFAMPAVVPMMTLESLEAFIVRGRSKLERKIGTTINVSRSLASPGDVVYVTLYETLIARVFASQVIVPDYVDTYGTQATREWLRLILSDNGVGILVYREDFHLNVAGVTYAAAPRTSRTWGPAIS